MIGTGGGRRTNRSPQQRTKNKSVRASFCHAVKPQNLTGIGNREGHEDDDSCGFMNLVDEHTDAGEVSFHQWAEHMAHHHHTHEHTAPAAPRPAATKGPRIQQRELGRREISQALGPRFVDPDLRLRFGISKRSNELRAGRGDGTREAPEFTEGSPRGRLVGHQPS